MSSVINLKRRFDKAILIAIIASLTVMAIRSLDMVQRIEWIAYDRLLSTKREAVSPPAEIVVILVDDASLQFMDPIVGRWPWPRSVFADVIDYVSMGNPQSIIFDMLFVERQLNRSSGNDSSDQRLMESTATAGNVIHAMQFIKDKQDELNADALNQPLPDLLTKRYPLSISTDNNVPVDPAVIKESADYNNYLVPIEGLYQHAMNLGVVSVDPDHDGVLRRTPLLFQYQSAWFPALSVSPLLRSDATPIDVQPDQIKFAESAIQLDRRARYLVNFYPRFNTFSMSGILSSIAALNDGDVEHIMVHPDEFRDKYVFIGSSAVGLHDLKTTPLGGKQPGVYLHASVLANVLRGDMLSPPQNTVTLLCIVIASLVTALGVLYWRLNTIKLLWPAVVCALLGGWGYWQFFNNQVVSLVAPLIAIALSSVLGYTYLLFTEGREKNKVRKKFSQYVSSAALSAMVDNYDEYKNADTGTKETVTMLFCDIRGFTTLSEVLAPEKVVEMLNFYFTNMTEAILEHHGTIDKFIGDAIMATWGAPIKTTTHATDAVHAAIAMIGKLTIVNLWLEQHDLQPIDIGIGIHTGEVILGSIGSEQKADYTVIGDNVNLASRLEGATKTYGCQLILSEKTYEQLTDDIPCVLIDMIRVKGKQQPIKIYTPISLLADNNRAIDDTGAMVQQIQQALDAYLQQYWEDAIARFQSLPHRQLGELYVKRCQQFKTNPPPANWDGVYTMKNK